MYRIYIAVFICIFLFSSVFVFTESLSAGSTVTEGFEVASFFDIKKVGRPQKESAKTEESVGKKAEESDSGESKAEESDRAEGEAEESVKEEKAEQPPLREGEEQDKEKPVTEPPKKAEEPEKPPPRKPLVAVKKGEVSFNFDDADVYTVIQTIFGDVLRVNYIIDPDVQGRVNFRTVSPVAKKDVLPLMEVILRHNDIGVVEEGGLYRIIPIGELPKEPADVGIGKKPDIVEIGGKALLQIIPLDYIESTEMVRILEPFLSTNALILDVPQTNNIVIVDTDANIKKLMKLVELFDSEELKETIPQVYVYPVQNSKAVDVADILTQIFLEGKPAEKKKAATPRSEAETRAEKAKTTRTKTPAKPRTQVKTVEKGETVIVSELTRVIPDEVTNSIIILATPEDYVHILSAIEKIDIEPRQVSIEALIARVDLTDNLSFGIQWTIQNDVHINWFGEDIDLSGPLDLLTPIENANFTYTALDAAGNIKLLIQTLAAEGKATVMASPHIIVSDNRDARIQVGQQIPIPTSQTNVTGTTDIQTTFQYKDIGIILEVTPQVNESGLVALDLRQEVSSTQTPDAAISAGAAPVINVTETQTNLVAHDGQTIIIGGLIREDVIQGREGVPVLHKIPILGYLFGKKTEDTLKNELIVLLTPRVVKDYEEAGDVTSDYIERFKGSMRKEKIDYDEFISTGQEEPDTEDQESEPPQPETPE